VNSAGFSTTVLPVARAGPSFGAGSNPLLASFAALIALLLWLNLSAQVILLASTWIIVAERERVDRVRERFGSPTFALRRVRQAEDAVRVATEELDHARTAAEEERAKQKEHDEKERQKRDEKQAESSAEKS
jgi:membrane protein